jgi:ADP-heptose:LPS heptosyltransferase
MKKLLLKCHFALGDVVMLTAAIRDLHRCYPRHFLTDVRTAYDGLWDNNSLITRLRDGDPKVEQLDCHYPLIERCDGTPYHCLHGFIEFLNDRLGLAIKPTAFKGDIRLSAQEKVWYSQIHEFTGEDAPFWIVAAGGKHDVTIKWWESVRYQEVIDHFRGRIQFVQVGERGHHHPRLNGVIDLRGQTSLRELIRLVYHSQGVLCSVTGLMHLAAAVETRPGRPPNRACVVVAGGREPAHWEAYPGHQFIHTNGMLPCCLTEGCWRDRTTRLRDGNQRDRADHRCVDVVGALPRCMDMITPAEVIGRMDAYFQGGVLEYLSPHQAKGARRGIAATTGNPFDQLPLSLQSAGLALEQFIRTIPPFPDRFAGRGIVICGGGPKYFPNLWVCINMLRRLGCQSGVQVWHLGWREMDGRMKALLAKLGVECVDAFKVRKTFPVRMLHGWAVKPYAMLHSRFHEVLLLDADNVPVVNPDFLFDVPEYKSSGAVFWPDVPIPGNAKATAIWRSCGLRQPDEPEFETGQILLDKKRCWPSLSLAMWFNENSDFYYRHLHGDKETFHLAFRKLKQLYSLVNTPVHELEGTFCQHDFDGRRIFQHRTRAKWKLSGRNPMVQGFRFEKECRAYLARLRRTLRAS